MRNNFNAVKRPWAVFWKRRALPPSSRWALRLVEDYLPQLVAEKGGPENVTFAESKVLETAMVARVCWTLAMLAEDFESVARFLRIEAQSLQAVGLGRRARQVPSLASFVAQAQVERPADSSTSDRA